MICLLPVAAFWLTRWFFYRKIMEEHGTHDCHITTEELASRLQYTAKLPQTLQKKQRAEELAEVLLLSAFDGLQAQHLSPLRIRKRADTFIVAIVPFSLLIAVFAIFVGKSITFVLLCVAAVNALGAIMKFSTRSIAAYAVERATESLLRLRLPRQTDEEVIITCLKALTWR
jgi:hypothetical protein